MNTDPHLHLGRSVHGRLPFDLDGVEVLAELALDLRWSWSHAGDALWERLDPVLWHRTRNPWGILQTVSRDRLAQALGEPQFRRQLDAAVQARREDAVSDGWFQKSHPETPLRGVAYFSMEFMLSEALPIYSGGLGNVAGDQLKTASDLGVPVIGVGLLYQQGYFRQVIDAGGAQHALYPYNEPGQLPVTPLRQDDGQWLRLKIDLPHHALWLRAWQVQVGRTRLLLLDSNDSANDPVYRGITSELYGGGPEMRLRQELILGIGGWRLLEALGAAPEVCHLNEGHAAFAVLERARGFMRDTGQPFDVALSATRAGNLFTTHTAVPAGFDRFAPDLIERHLGRYARDRLGIGTDALLALGRRCANDADEPFNMAYLAVRGSGAVNAVSRLHGQVSRRLFAPLFPRWPVDEVPIGHVTNGVHMPSWDSAPADELWTAACGKDRWRGVSHTLERDIRRVGDAELWAFRNAANARLVPVARERLAGQLAAAGAAPDAIEAAEHVLEPHVLTLGFARRFATYKRSNLLLHDPDRLARLLTDARRPVQLVLAGKAHPADGAGQAVIRQWHDFIRRPDVRGRVVFLADYDMRLAEELVQGVDVWVNTPRRPWEASGTSGMKVLVNGGINLSELDGWWAEAYTPDVGWAIGDGREHDDDAKWDALDADRLYRLLEDEVAPQFYDRDERGIPHAWLARMRESMARLAPRFSADRTVREYTEQHYLPAAAAVRARTADRGAAAARRVDQRHVVDRHWPAVRFESLQSQTQDGRHRWEVRLALGALDPDAVCVQLYADAADGHDAERLEMKPGPTPIDAASGARLYSATAPDTRPPGDYTARAFPRDAHESRPLEDARILWQR